MRIKICGLFRTEDIDFANECMPDYAGFVVYKPSPRYVEYDYAEHLRDGLDRNILSVGVFVDTPVNVIENLYLRDVITIAQLHGNQDLTFISELSTIGIPIIQVLKVGEQTLDLSKISEHADFLLFDGPGIGGEGVVFDWDKLRSMDIPVPYFIAGGINLTNIDDALQISGAFGLDISSGAEQDGIKSLSKMKELVDRVRSFSK
jgi:phosphoribosylanthranilate isomerase